MTFYPRTQPLDADLAAIAALTTTAFGRGVLDDANAAALRATAGLGTAAVEAATAFQSADAALTSFAALATAADKIAYTTGVDTWAEAAITAGGRAFVAGTATAAQVAALGAESAWTYVILGSDFVTGNDTPTNVTGFKFTPAASKTYAIVGSYGLRSASATVGAQPGIAWPTGYTDGWAIFTAPDSGTSTTTVNATAGTAAAAAAFNIADAVTTWPGHMEATLITGAGPAGDFQVTLESETAATNVTMRAGSWFAYKAIA